MFDLNDLETNPILIIQHLLHRDGICSLAATIFWSNAETCMWNVFCSGTCRAIVVHPRKYHKTSQTQPYFPVEEGDSFIHC